jgi:hypothetical protein
MVPYIHVKFMIEFSFEKKKKSSKSKALVSFAAPSQSNCFHQVEFEFAPQFKLNLVGGICLTRFCTKFH